MNIKKSVDFCRAQYPRKYKSCKYVVLSGWRFFVSGGWYEYVYAKHWKLTSNRLFLQWDRTHRSTALPVTGRCFQFACGARKVLTAAFRSDLLWRRTTRQALAVDRRMRTTRMASPLWPPTGRPHRCWLTWRPTDRTSHSGNWRRLRVCDWPSTRLTRVVLATARGWLPTHLTRPTNRPLPVRNKLLTSPPTWWSSTCKDYRHKYA